jgi:hypothetical protein
MTPDRLSRVVEHYIDYHVSLHRNSGNKSRRRNGLASGGA